MDGQGELGGNGGDGNNENMEEDEDIWGEGIEIGLG